MIHKSVCGRRKRAAERRRGAPPPIPSILVAFVVGAFAAIRIRGRYAAD